MTLITGDCALESPPAAPAYRDGTNLDVVPHRKLGEVLVLQNQTIGPVLGPMRHTRLVGRVELAGSGMPYKTKENADSVRAYSFLSELQTRERTLRLPLYTSTSSKLPAASTAAAAAAVGLARPRTWMRVMLLTPPNSHRIRLLNT